MIDVSALAVAQMCAACAARDAYEVWMLAKGGSDLLVYNNRMGYDPGLCAGTAPVGELAGVSPGRPPRRPARRPVEVGVS